MAPKLSRPSASPQAVLDLFKVHLQAQQLACARSKPGQWFDCCTDKERYSFLENYQSLVQAVIELDPYVLKSTLNEVFLQLNQWQDGRLAGKDAELWARAQAYHFRNLLALSRKIASRCTTGLRLPAAVRSVVEHVRHQKTVSSSSLGTSLAASPVASSSSRLGTSLAARSPSLPKTSGHCMACQLLVGQKSETSPAARRNQC